MNAGQNVGLVPVSFMEILACVRVWSDGPVLYYPLHRIAMELHVRKYSEKTSIYNHSHPPKSL